MDFMYISRKVIRKVIRTQKVNVVPGQFTEQELSILRLRE